MFGPFATGNNDATFPVNKFLAATIIFPRVNSATKTGRAVYFSRLQGMGRYLHEAVRVYEKRNGARCAQFNIGSSISMRRVTQQEGSNASGPRR